MKTTLQTTIKKNILTIIAIVILAGLSGYSTYKVSVLTTEIEDLKAGGSIYALQSELDDLNERHEKLATAFYELGDVFDDNVVIYNDAIKELRESVTTIADIVKKILNSNYY